MLQQTIRKILNREPITVDEFSPKLIKHFHSFRLSLTCSSCKLNRVVSLPVHHFSNYLLNSKTRLLQDNDAESILKWGICEKCSTLKDGEFPDEQYPDLFKE
jgi:hypothetical protein